MSKTLGRLHLRGGHAGACAPDAATPAGLASAEYCRAAQETWRRTPAPDEPILPDGALLSDWVILDQRPRNVCVAFAAAAAVDLLRRSRDGAAVAPASAQFIYWMMRRAFPLPDHDRPPGYEIGATRLSQARDVIETTGVCPDHAAPFYLGLLDPDTAPEGTAPSEAAHDAADPGAFAPGDYGIYPSADRPKDSLSARFHAILKDGRPVCAGFPMFGTTSGRSNWHTVGALRTGEVLGPIDPDSGILAGTAAESGHVVCLVGYVPDADRADEGWFVFRNSWGVEFGRARNRRLPWLPPGYGTISAGHVDQFCWEYYAPRLA